MRSIFILHGVMGLVRRSLEFELLFVLLIMPLSKVCRQCEAVVYTIKADFARQEQDIKLKVPLHYLGEGLALQCFLVFLVSF